MRRSRDQMLMMMAEAAAGRSTCSRLNVGAVIALDNRPISTGYNGAPAGVAHCDHREHQGVWNEGGCKIAVHAEANAIIFAARHGVAIAGAELFSTHEPCLACCNMIINAGITRVVFLHPYRDHAGLELLNSVGMLTIGYSSLSDHEG
jgi:dCMP deaminase